MVSPMPRIRLFDEDQRGAKHPMPMPGIRYVRETRNRKPYLKTYFKFVDDRYYLLENNKWKFIAPLNCFEWCDNSDDFWRNEFITEKEMFIVLL